MSERREGIRTVELPDGTKVPMLGQGTWNIGDDPNKRQEEIAALREGIERGMTLIDTAEMYGSGRSEQLVGEAIAGKRDEVFLVSKVYPHNAGGEQLIRSCEASLRRLKTERIDLYLLHWRGSIPLGETVAGMQRLVREGKIARWGVSNLDLSDMEELMDSSPDAARCTTNQVLYHLGSRGIEYELLPWQRAHRMPVMAYSPLAQAGTLRRGLIQNEAVQAVAGKHGITPYQVLLAWSIRGGDVIAIPKASSRLHAVDNAAVGAMQFEQSDWARLDEAFPPPKRRMPLDMI